MISITIKDSASCELRGAGELSCAVSGMVEFARWIGSWLGGKWHWDTCVLSITFWSGLGH